MDFFEHQRRARRRTGWLILAFFVAVLGVGLFVHCGIMSLVLWLDQGYSGPFLQGFWQHPASSRVFGLSLFFVAFIVCLGSAIKIRELADGGGEYVAEMLGGREVSPFTLRFEEKRLLNIVEEMAIASGIVIPTVYILEKEYRINSFAAGFDQDEAVIGVTRGALDYLDRDELQAIVAHEFSHILNGDIVLNMRMMGVLYGLGMITQLGVELLRRHGIDMSEKGKLDVGDEPVPITYGRDWRALIASIVFGLILMTIGLVACLFGAIIKAAITRQRELLADASAIQFTRNPAALKSAFVKIGCPRVGSTVYSAHALEASHLFLGGPFGESSRWNLLAAHPAWISRIRRFEPRFDGTFPKRVMARHHYGEKAYIGKHDEALIDELLATTNPRLCRTFARTRIAEAQERQRKIEEAEKTEKAEKKADGPKPVTIPPIIVESFETPVGCCSVVFALLLDKDQRRRKEQLDGLEVLTARLSVVEMDRIKEISEAIVVSFSVEQTMAKTSEARKLRSAFVRIRSKTLRESLPKLRLLSKDDYADFRRVCSHLTGDVNKINLFRYTLFTVFRHELDPLHRYGTSEAAAVRYHSISDVEPSLRLALSYLAYAGHAERNEAENAFRAGLDRAGLKRDEAFGNLLPLGDCSFPALDESLRQLRAASPPIRTTCLEAFETVLWNDEKMTAREEEIFLAATAMLQAEQLLPTTP